MEAPIEQRHRGKMENKVEIMKRPECEHLDCISFKVTHLSLSPYSLPTPEFKVCFGAFTRADCPVKYKIRLGPRSL